MLPAGPPPLEQHQLERRVDDREVRVPRLPLGRCRPEHLGVEVDRLLEVIDVEGELETHVVLSSRLTAGNRCPDSERHVDERIDISQYDAMVRPDACCSPLRQAPLGESDAAQLADALKALADPVRLQLVSLMTARGEMCACDLPGLVGRTQPTVSHHLSILTGTGIVEREQRGKWAWFRAVPERLDELAAAIGR
jgi:ArsR family transcriptional regulator